MDIEDFIDEKIGEGLVRMGEMTEEQVSAVLQKQSEGDERLFGEIAVELDYIDVGTVIRYMEHL
ncbi:MAG: hypothetical protein PQJ46_03080 [Spirochaetales bacterium]|nr:hypothetical protein [Spirochaetales bacterium]